MKVSRKEQERINEWWRKHGDKMYKPLWGAIRLSSANTKEHNLRVCEICCCLLEMGIPFATEVRLSNGVRPDIVAPTHVRPIIEVLWSESEADFKEKKADKYPLELQGKWILHDAKKPFEEISIL